MRSIKSSFMLLFSFLCLMICLSNTTFAEEYSGETEGLHWLLSEEGMLSIIVEENSSFSPTSTSDIPWYAYRNQVTNVIIHGDNTQIWAYAFSDCKNLKSISFPEEITKIGNNAFYGCSSLDEIVFPNTLMNIGDEAFRGCSITSIVVPDTVTYIGSGAFRDCPLISLTVPFVGMSQSDSTTLSWRSPLGAIFGNSTVNSNTASIDNATFQYFNGYSYYYWYYIPKTLRSVTVTNAQVIPSEAFLNCSFITSVLINSEVNAIGEKAFSHCGLSSLTIPDGITIIEQETFAYCTNLQQVELPSTLEVIKDHAFDHCAKLNGVEFGTHLTRIASHAFSSCSSLDEISFPSSLTSIEQYAFAGCSSLTEIVVPQSVTYIGPFAFRETPLISLEIPFIGNSATDSSDTHLGAIFGYRSLGSATGSVDGAVLQHIEVIDATDCVVNYDWYYIPATLRNVKITGSSVIPSEAFWNCYFLTSISIPDGATTIGESAFMNCTGLRNFNIPSTVTVIQSEAFNNCLNLGNITLPQNLMSIGEKAFYNCASITIEAFPDKLESIGDYAFYACHSLDDIAIPDKMECISEGAFRECTGLTTLYTGNNVTIIKANAFQDCSNLSNISFGDELLSIWNDAFRGCTALHEINFPSKLNSIGYHSFADCTGLTDVVVPNSVTSIGEGAFRIEGLASISLPFVGRSRTSTGKDAVFGIIFDYRTLSSSTGSVDNAINQQYISPYYYWYYIPASLKSVTITDATSIPDYAFNNCVNISEINIHSNITSIGKYAFSKCKITSFSIPENVETIENYAFNETKLQTVIIPDTVTTIGSYAFYNVPLEAVTFSSGLKRIGSHAFSGCNKLTAIDLPSGLQNISDRAFAGVSLVTSLYVPSTVTYIGDGAFSGMNGLTNLSVPFVGNSKSSTGYNGVFGIIFDYRTVNSSTASVDDGTFQFYNGYYNYYWYYIPRSLQTVEITGDCDLQENAFYNCSRIKHLIINGQITNIGKDAFKNSGVNRVDVPDIASWLNISFSNSNAKPSADLYVNDELVVDLIVPSSITKINAYSFLGNSALISVTLPKELTDIEHDAFNGCTNLSAVTYDGDRLRKSQITIGSNNVPILSAEWVLNNYGSCGNNLSYELNDQGILTISGSGAMFDFTETVQPWNPSEISAVLLPEELSYIGDYGFAYCSNVQTLKLPDGLTGIGSNAFKSCSSLQSLIIPTGVVTFPEGIFNQCSNLDLYCHDQITLISQNAFGVNGSSDLQHIYCNPKTQTSSCLGNIGISFSLIDGPYDLIEKNGFVQVISYDGLYSSVIKRHVYEYGYKHVYLAFV